MPIDKVWIYQLLLVCLCVCLWLWISPPRIKIVASNFARWFIGVLGRKSPIFGNFAPPEAQNWTNRSLDWRQHNILFIVQWAHGPNAAIEMCRSWNCAACGCRIGMCGYTAVPEDGRTCYYHHRRCHRHHHPYYYPPLLLLMVLFDQIYSSGLHGSDVVVASNQQCQSTEKNSKRWPQTTSSFHLPPDSWWKGHCWWHYLHVNWQATVIHTSEDGESVCSMVSLQLASGAFVSLGANCGTDDNSGSALSETVRQQLSAVASLREMGLILWSVCRPADVSLGSDLELRPATSVSAVEDARSISPLSGEMRAIFRSMHWTTASIQMRRMPGIVADTTNSPEAFY